jgi:hypothetical protein
MLVSSDTVWSGANQTELWDDLSHCCRGGGDHELKVMPDGTIDGCAGATKQGHRQNVE